MILRNNNKQPKNLIILTDRNKFKLPYGDYLRIFAFLPNLKFKKIIFVGDKELLTLAKEHEFLSPISNNNEKKINYYKRNSFIFDAVKKAPNSNKSFYLRSILKSNHNKKNNMANLIKNLAIYFNIKKYKLFHNKTLNNKFKYDVFFSWQAPSNWKIKEYPFNKLLLLDQRIKKELRLKTKFQNKNQKMYSYIDNIKRSKIIISIVNLGCHIANFYNKNLIMLSGPNFHDDSLLQKNQVTIFPKNFCKIHVKAFKYKKYKNRVGNIVNNHQKCKCMDNIDIDEIFESLKNILKRS